LILPKFHNHVFYINFAPRYFSFHLLALLYEVRNIDTVYTRSILKGTRKPVPLTNVPLM